MKRFGSTILAATLSFSAAGTAFAQGTPQSVSIVDIKSISSGYRASKVVGSDVRNDADEVVGKVDDLIIGRGNSGIFAIISVGGFLGMGNKLVAVRYHDLRVRADNKSFLMPGATKDALKGLPEYTYSD